MVGHILDTAIEPVLRSGEGVLRAEFAALFLGWAKETDKERVKVKIPVPEHLMERHEGMHYHFKPEIFLQLQGTTEFQFPGEKLNLRSGQLAIIPAGVPHREAVFADTQPFRNAVVGFYSNTVSVHYAYEVAPQKPDIESIEFYHTPELGSLIALVEQLVRRYHGQESARPLAVRALATGLLAGLAGLLEAPAPQTGHDSAKIIQVKWFVRDQLYNPRLNVKFLASRMNCSADYLSHVFHQETSETLIHYINRQRLQGAVQALAGTRLSVSEIAWACGYSDPGYFTRVFKKFYKMTPLEYRTRLESGKRSLETQPKTIYHDHVDYSPGRAAR